MTCGDTNEILRCEVIEILRCPIPTNDIWITAQAVERNAEMLAFNQHFRFMEPCGVKALVYET